jgi:polysaccharide pyruvyl transferase WcaK-like protein
LKVVGWYGHHNVGDESYKLSFPLLFPAQPFTFNDPITLQGEQGTAVLGGGDILNKRYVDKVLAGPFQKRIAMSVSANSLTPFDQLRCFDQIFVRDMPSVRLLESQGISSRYMPDVSLIMQPNKTNGEQWIKNQFLQKGLDLYTKKIGIVFNAYLFGGRLEMLARDFVNFFKVMNELVKIIDGTSASFIFFPMSTGLPYDDRVTNGLLSSQCKFWRKNLMIHEQLGVQETLDMIAACDLVISSRLHSTLFSLISNTPFMDITHHDKNKNILETFGLKKHSFSYWSFDSLEFEAMLKSLLNDSQVYKDELAQIYSEQLAILKRESQHVRFV